MLASTDVVHSLYVPQFRLKQDAVPGRYTRMTFTPTVAGTFPILCAEYCGTNHSKMEATVVVHPDQASWDAWAREGVAPGESLVALGQRVFNDQGCSGCHSVDGTPGVGPSLKGLWGLAEILWKRHYNWAKEKWERQLNLDQRCTIPPKSLIHEQLRKTPAPDAISTSQERALPSSRICLGAISSQQRNCLQR